MLPVMDKLLASLFAILMFHAAPTQCQEPEYPACVGDGMIVNGIFGIISSPNYPNNYPNNLACTWNIQGLENTRIAVRFERLFSLERLDEFSCYDKLWFSEEGSDYITHCGDEPYPSFVSLTNSLRVNFESDALVNFPGFSFNWTAVVNTSVPDPVYTMIESDNGTLSSPGYPNMYEPFLNYSWRISASPEKYILLEFEPHFGIEGISDTNCPYDSLVISEGSSAPSIFDEKQQLCASSTPSRLMLRNNELYVSFKSDIIVSGVGFSFNFTTIDPPRCHGLNQQNGTSGIVSTPLYPILYDNKQRCSWAITAPENMLIAVRFDALFSIATSTKCATDFVEVFDGPDEDSESQYLGHKFCGNTAPRGFLSSNNQLFVRFESGSISTTDNIGFSFTWTTEAKCARDQFRCWDGSCINATARCNGVVECPADYADEAVCSDENSTNCGIADASPVFKWDARIVGGHEAQKGSWPWQGYFRVLFYGSWRFRCGAVLLSNEWAVTAAHCILKGLTSAVTFGDYDLTDSDPEAEQIATIDEIFASSAYKHVARGYLNGSDVAVLHLSPPINYTRWVKPACLPQSPPIAGENLVLTGWGVKRFEDLDDVNVNIMRQVRVPVVTREACNKAYGYELNSTIFCSGITAGGASSCSGDSGGSAVRLRDSSWELAGIPSFSRQCGALPEKPSAFVNVYNLLPYINDVLENGMEEIVITNVVIQNKESGVITSPNYGAGNYPTRLHMRWHIIVSKNKGIEIGFNSSFDIEQSLDGIQCSGDYLMVYDGVTTASVKYGNKKLCGKVPPPNFVSNSNSFIVEFYSDNSFESTGFSLIWQAVDDCDADKIRCWDQTCIPKEKKCNGVGDCAGNEDEFECATATLGSTVCGKAEISPQFPFTPLVVGGHNAKEGSWPWQVMLKVEREGQYSFTCGGTLIAEEWVMTAAHCLGSENYQVVIGEYNSDIISSHERTINVTYKFIPAEYRGHFPDIGFLKLAEKVDFSSKWYKPICLPPPGDMGPPTNTTCVVSGWGQTGVTKDLYRPQIMQQSHVRVLNDTACIDFFSTQLTPEGRSHFICAGLEHERANSCFGDSGGPLACLVNGTWTQYGIVSFGSGRCGYRTAYQRVELFLDFFEQAKNFKGCSGLELRVGSAGTVEPPILQNRYLPDTNCSWLLRGPSDTVLVLRFDEVFAIEICYPRESVYLKIYDGNSTNAAEVFHEALCGENRTIRAFESSTNEVLINFVSDGSGQFAGFKITWEAVANCKSDHFRCWDGSCIKQSLKCDLTEDCTDGSDEKECAHEGSECGRQDVAPLFLWAQRITGGSFAKNGSWPFQALVTDGFYYCGGTIVNDRWILTSTTCVSFRSTSDISVVVGEIGREDVPESSRYGVVNSYTPDNEDGEIGYDIVLLKLNRTMTLSSTIQPACMAMPNVTDVLTAGEVCVVLGWGNTYEGNFASRWLRQTRVPVLDQQACEKAWETSYFPDRMFCSENINHGGVGACYDDGGPLLCLRNNVWVQFGVVTSFYGGGAPGSPDYFTRVSFHMDWIERTIGEKLPVHILKSPTTTKPTTSAMPAHETTLETTTAAKHTANTTKEPAVTDVSSTTGVVQTTSIISTTTSGTKSKALPFAATSLFVVCSLYLNAP